MAIIAKNSTFVTAPAGTFPAVCCDVVDLGVLKTEYKGVTKEQRKINICWQISERMQNTGNPELDGKLYLVRRRYTLSLGEKASLKRDLESWRGKAFTVAELLGFDVEIVLHAPCMLSIIHEASEGGTFANVNGVMKLPKGMVAPSVEGYIRVKDRTPDQQKADHSQDGDQSIITDDDVPF